MGRRARGNLPAPAKNKGMLQEKDQVRAGLTQHLLDSLSNTHGHRVCVLEFCPPLILVVYVRSGNEK